MTILTRRVISLFDKKTTMRLSQDEWHILNSICLQEKIKRKSLFEMIEKSRDEKINFTQAVRLFSLLYLYAHFEKHSKSPDIEQIMHRMCM